MPKSKTKGTYFFLVFLCLIFLLMLLSFPEISGNEIKASLKFCSEILIPSVFPQAVICAFLQGLLSKNAHGNDILNRAVSLYLSFFGGYCCGALCVKSKRGQEPITERQCLLSSVALTLASPQYLICVVGRALFADKKIGYCLVSAQALASLTLILVFYLLHKKETARQSTVIKAENTAISEIFTAAIEKSAFSMLSVCACTVFFSVLCKMCDVVFVKLSLSDLVKAIIFGLLDVSYLIRFILTLDNKLTYFPLICLSVGFSGLSVLTQIKTIVGGSLKFSRLLAGKAVFALLCLFYGLILSFLTV